MEYVLKIFGLDMNFKFSSLIYGVVVVSVNVFWKVVEVVEIVGKLFYDRIKKEGIDIFQERFGF